MANTQFPLVDGSVIIRGRHGGIVEVPRFGDMVLLPSSRVVALATLDGFAHVSERRVAFRGSRSAETRVVQAQKITAMPRISHGETEYVLAVELFEGASFQAWVPNGVHGSNVEVAIIPGAPINEVVCAVWDHVPRLWLFSRGFPAFQE